MDAKDGGVRWLAAAMVLAFTGVDASGEERGESMARRLARPFDLTMNIDFYDVLNCQGKGHAPSIGDRDHYPREYLERLIEQAAGAGFTSVNFRVDYVGRVGINGSPNRDKPVHHKLFMRTLEHYDPLRVAIDAAGRHGVKCYAWLTPLDNCGLEFGKEKRHITQSTFSFEHPEYHLCARDGTDRIGVYCFGYKPVRDYMVEHLERVLEYRPDAVFLSNRTHANFKRGHKLEYGFNAPTVDEYKRRHGVDPREPEHYDLARFSDVLGSFYTQFLREAAAKVHAAGLPLMAAVSWRRDGRIAARLGALDRRFFQWRTWVNDGLVDVLVIGGDGATSFDSPEHVLGHFETRAESADPGFFRARLERPAHIYRWLTLFGWGWKGAKGVTGSPVRSFTGAWGTRMVGLVRDAGADGAFMHEAICIQIHDQWDHYRRFMSGDRGR